MANGMWTAAAGAAVQAQNLDVIANNLANSDTPSFKKDIPTFKEYLATVEREHEAMDIPRGHIKDKDFYPLDGRDESYVIMDGTTTNYSQGGLRVTQRQLDLALDGPGLLEVSTPMGIRYTRDGALKVAADGKLVNSDGFPVLSASTAAGAAPAAREINLRDKGAHFQINAAGEIYSEDNLIARLSVLEAQEPKHLKKAGGQLYLLSEPPPVPFAPPTPGAGMIQASRTLVRQGVLETSNVNPIEEMTNMIKANRLFEHDLKSLKTYGEMMGKEVNEVGKL